MKNVVLFVLLIFVGIGIASFFNFDVLMQNHSICPFATLDCEHGTASLINLNDHLSGIQYLTSLILGQSIYVFSLLILSILFFGIGLLGLGNELPQLRPLLVKAEQESTLSQRRLLKWLVLRKRRDPALLDRAFVTDLGGP